MTYHMRPFIKKFLPAAAPILLCGCFAPLASPPRSSPGLIVAEAMTREPEFDLEQDPASDTSFFAWSPVSASSVSAVSLLGVDPQKALTWGVSLQKGSPAPRQFGARIAVSSTSLYAVWYEDLSGQLSFNAAAFDGWGQPLLEKAAVAGLSGFTENTGMIISGPDNSAYAAWQDFNPRIKAPFVGIAALGPGGVRWRSVLGDREESERYMTPVIASAGPDGILAAFRHIHGGDKGIVVRRFNSDGSSWPDDVPVSDVIGYKSAPRIVDDGRGGAFVIWEDGRNGNVDIYGQHISSDGVVLWETGGRPFVVAEGNQWSPMLVSDGAGGFYCGWIDDNMGSRWVLKVQHVGPDGRGSWGLEGLTVCEPAGDQVLPYLDSSGRVSPGEGLPAYVSAGNQSLPSMTADGEGGVILAWDETRYEKAGVFAQRFEPGGGALWGENGAAVAVSDRDEVGPQLVPDGNGGCLIAWKHRIGRKAWELRAQRLNEDGEPVWR